MEGLVSRPVSLRLSASAPAGWHVKESLTLIEPSAQANVIASSEPIDPSVGSEQYAWAQGDLMRQEFPGYEEVSFTSRPLFGARLGLERRLRWHPEDGPPIQQIQLYFAEAARGNTATATTTVPDFERLCRDLERILAGLHLVQDPGPSGFSTGSALRPLDPATLQAIFDHLGYRHEVFAPEAVIARFALDQARAGRPGMFLIAQLDSADEYSLLVQAVEPYAPISSWWQLLNVTKAWNDGHGRPMAVVARRPQEPNELEVMLRHRLHLPHGASIEQLASATEQILAATDAFWTWAHSEHGI